MILHKLAPLLALGLNLLLLGSALASDRKSPRVRSFAYMVSALAAWNFGVLGLRWSDDPDVALAWERLLHLAVIPVPVLFYHYVLVFLDVPRRRPSLIVGYLLSGFFLAASPTAAFMPGITQTDWGFAPVAGRLYGPFLVYFQGYLVVGLVWLVRAYRTARSSFRKNRTLLVIVGVVVSLLGGAVDFLRFVLDWERVYPVAIPSNAVFALALGIAIVRYRLMDLGVLAKRLVLYLLTSIVLAPILFFGPYLLGQLAPDYLMSGTDLGEDLRYGLVVLLGFTAALPFLRKLEGRLDRLMFQRQHGVRDALVALGRETSSLLEIQRLGRTVTEGLVARIPVLHASLHVHDPATDSFVLLAQALSDAEAVQGAPTTIDPGLALWLRVTGKSLVVEEAAFHAMADRGMRAAGTELEASRVALLMPLLLGGELMAILVVGEKLSGEIFDAGEIELLETLVGHTAIALKNSRLYEDLRKQMDELQRTQQQLVQSAKLAAIGELASAVAHEVNNPLTVITGISDVLLEETPPDSLTHQKLARIAGEADRAGKIIRDLLDFVRKREPRREPLDVRGILRRALNLLQVRFASARAYVETIFDPSAPLILADADQLTQVFVNLISNAVDAMPADGHLVIRTELRQRDGEPAVAVSVTDTGIGMGSDQLARLFEPFYTTKPESRGTGLGLSISLGIVRRHGGTIDVESRPGVGTTMVVNLPVRTTATSMVSVVVE
ncbi:MAG: GAF domain-containing protein [Candidatus Rokubacteria bacterium]|nr:GAF domain-containing protein [Candidatus Rokubacteria bacterium]